MLDLPVTMCASLPSKLSSFIDHGKWDIPEAGHIFHSVVAQILKVVLPKHPITNMLVWPYSSDSDLSSKQATQFLLPSFILLP